MVRTFYEENFGSVDVASEYNGQPVQAEETFVQSLSYILGYIAQKKAWKPLLSDTDGRLLVSTSPTKSNSSNHSNPNLAASSFLVLAENEDRKAYVIQNTSGQDVYLSFDGGDATTNDFLLVNNATWVDDIYYGKVTGIAASASGSLRVVEFS